MACQSTSNSHSQCSSPQVRLVSGGNRRQRGVRGERLGPATTLQKYIVGPHSGRPGRSRGHYGRRSGRTDHHPGENEGRATSGVGGFCHLDDGFLANRRLRLERRAAVSARESLLLGGSVVGASIAQLTLGPSVEGDVSKVSTRLELSYSPFRARHTVVSYSITSLGVPRQRY
ncbi:hypothetical protein EYF80_016466 [Liparis tanakae]|uniref:Uncharacterized protein n=1 Tax=Liparis tanakae TaxID=230148 RepID=A0A4Z2I845_9TELE|nr:hypothetical protein EYF80_016466 [Liparis tanakae]